MAFKDYFQRNDHTHYDSPALLAGANAAAALRREARTASFIVKPVFEMDAQFQARRSID
jgi:hypothetical protein